MHIADLLSPEDLRTISHGRFIPRLDGLIAAKEALFNRVLDVFESEGKAITTMEKLVSDAFASENS